MQRTLLGLIAAASLLGGLALWLLALWHIAPAEASVIGLGIMRLGIMFAVVWLAIPNFRLISARVPQWLLFGTVAGLCVIAVKPRTIVLIGPILVALWAIGPKWFGRLKK